MQSLVSLHTQPRGSLAEASAAVLAMHGSFYDDLSSKAGRVRLCSCTCRRRVEGVSLVVAVAAITRFLSLPFSCLIPSCAAPLAATRIWSLLGPRHLGPIHFITTSRKLAGVNIRCTVTIDPARQTVESAYPWIMEVDALIHSTAHVRGAIPIRTIPIRGTKPIRRCQMCTARMLRQLAEPKEAES